MMTTRLDIIIEQGADYCTPFTFSINLTSFSAYMQIRLAPNYPTSILNLASVSGSLIINPSSGTILPIIPGVVSSTILSGRYVYDLLLLSPAGEYIRAYQGNVYVSPEVTEDQNLLPTNIYTTEFGDPYITESGDYYVTEI